MKFIEQMRPWIGRKAIRGALVLLVLVFVVIFIVNNGNAEPEVAEPTLPLVSVTTPTEYAGGQSLSLIGTVRAFTEANLKAERSGRVTTVPVTLGQTVQGGQVIATLENSAEQAAVLQAEGVYDAALANTAQSGVSLEQAITTLTAAEKNAVSTLKASYNTVAGVVFNTVDPFFSSPNTAIPGLKIDGRGYTDTLNADRVALQTALPTWQSRVNQVTTESDLYAELTQAEVMVEDIMNMIDTFLIVFNQQGASSRYTDAELTSFSSSFTTVRANLNAVQNSIDTATTNLTSAEEGVSRAQLAATGSVNSAADAQVKQALGSLRAAQSNLAKTIIRTPISGTVNALSVRPGDFVNSFADVAQVANNNALEIVTYVSDSERSLITEGDEIQIENEYTGIVTQISPAVNPETKKIEVRISLEDAPIQNGDTVRVQKEIAAAASEIIIVPITAVKFAVNDGSVFLLDEDNVLVAQPVVLGAIRGDSVEIREGLTASERFVTDARGLQAGVAVEVTN